MQQPQSGYMQQPQSQQIQFPEQTTHPFYEESTSSSTNSRDSYANNATDGSYQQNDWNATSGGSYYYSGETQSATESIPEPNPDYPATGSPLQLSETTYEESPHMSSCTSSGSSSFISNGNPFEEEPEKCDRCLENPATVRCFDCNMKFCGECNTTLHGKGKWRAHDIQAIGNHNPSSHVSSLGDKPTLPSLVTEERTSPRTSPSSSSDTLSSQSAPMVPSSQVSEKTTRPLPTLERGVSNWGVRVSSASNKHGTFHTELGRARSAAYTSEELQMALQAQAEAELQSFPNPSLDGNVVRSPSDLFRSQSDQLDTRSYDAQSPAIPRSVSSMTVGPPMSPPSANAPPTKISSIREKIGANINLQAFKPPGNAGVRIQQLPRSTLPKNSSASSQASNNQVQRDAQQLRLKSLFYTLTIRIADRNIQAELLFPKCSTFSQVLQWSIKKLLNESVPEKKEKDKDYYQIQFEGRWMDPEKSLLSCAALSGKGEVLDLVKRKYQSTLLKIGFAEQDTYFTLRVEDSTSVWIVLQQIIKKLLVRYPDNTLPFPVDYYGLFFENSTEEIDEDELIYSYRDRFLEKLIFKKKDIQPTPNDMLLNILYNDVIPFEVSSQNSVDSLLKKFVKTVLVKSTIVPNPYEYIFGIPPSEEESEYELFLEESELLSKYPILNENNVIELKRRSRTYTIEVPDGTLHSMSFAENTLVKDCIYLVTHNYPELLKNVSNEVEFTMILADSGFPLVMDRTLASYEGNSFQVKRKLRPLVVFLGERNQKLLEVDYALPVARLMKQIWNVFGMSPKKESEYQLKRLSPDIAIDMNKSLSGQAIPYNSTILIKFVEPEKDQIIQADINIWEEVNDSTTLLFDEDKNTLRAGTLNKLVEKMTSQNAPDLEFMKAFLMTYPSFTTPQILLRKLLERYHVPISPMENNAEFESFRKTVVRPIQLRVCSVLKHWMETHWQDFDHELTQEIVAFADSLPPESSTLANQIRHAILNRTCGMKTRSKTTIGFGKQFPETIKKINKKETGTPFNIFDFDELEVARQLTLIEFDYYDKILPSELLGQAWSKSQQNSPNVLSMIARSTNVSLWIAGLILEPARVKVRAARFAKLIRISEHLRKLNNFSTLMAFLGGFNNSSVNRLKFTKQLLPKRVAESLAELENTMSVEGSSKNYRAALHNSNPPCIPYIGTSLSDLTFIDDGNKDVLTEYKLINFGKRMLTYRVIAELQRFQMLPYCFRPFSSIQDLIRQLPAYDDKTYNSSLYDISLAREPRGAEKVV